MWTRPAVRGMTICSPEVMGCIEQSCKCRGEHGDFQTINLSVPSIVSSLVDALLNVRRKS
jgi:hypothetical protein